MASHANRALSAFHKQYQESAHYDLVNSLLAQLCCDIFMSHSFDVIPFISKTERDVPVSFVQFILSSQAHILSKGYNQLCCQISPLQELGLARRAVRIFSRSPLSRSSAQSWRPVEDLEKCLIRYGNNVCSFERWRCQFFHLNCQRESQPYGG